MSYKQENITLSNLCEIRFGFQATVSKSGTIPYLQLKHFNEDSQLIELPVDQVEQNEKSYLHLLQKGDVLFVGKGNRLFAWEYIASLGPVIASPSFFVLRPEQTRILPSYLNTLLNAPQFKSQLQQLGAGTNIFSIRKSELGALEIPVPRMDIQEKITALSQLHQVEIALGKQILDTKQRLYKNTLSSLLS